MDLQSVGDNALTSENVPSIDNLRAHSPQTAGDSRPQPDTPIGLEESLGAQIAVPAVDPLAEPSRMRIGGQRSHCMALRYSPPMKAAVHTRYGRPDVVRISEVGKPTPKDNEVLVKVHATTVNRTDCACRAAKPFFMRFFTGLITPRATILGNEFAGVVEAVGSGVTAFELGDRVFGYNEGLFGAHAEY